jgi:hypothetical protein
MTNPMALSYNDSPYSMQYDNQYQTQQFPARKPSSAPYALAGLAIGGAGGAFLGFKKNPLVDKSGLVRDSFAHDVYAKYLTKNPNAGKEAYNQGLNIIKKIDSVKSADKLKSLLTSNSEAVKEMCAELEDMPEEFIQRITDDDLASNKKVIKERLVAGNKNRAQNIKNQIQACWNNQTKKFEQAESVKDEVFKSIKKVSNAAKSKVVTKYAAIGAVVTGCVAYLTHKVLTYQK